MNPRVELGHESVRESGCESVHESGVKRGDRACAADEPCPLTSAYIAVFTAISVALAATVSAALLANVLATLPIVFLSVFLSGFIPRFPQSFRQLFQRRLLICPQLNHSAGATDGASNRDQNRGSSDSEASLNLAKS